MTKTLQILRATEENLDDITELFSAYREFYAVDGNKSEARAFVKSRLANNESVIFIAYDNNIPCGFTQLYFTFSSLAMSPSIILNDLYVTEAYRQKGVATQLMDAVKNFATKNSYPTITLCTSKSNKKAQSLYEREGYKVDNEFIYYSLNLKDM